MKIFPVSDYPEPIPSLAAQLEDLERQLGQPGAPVDLEEHVVLLAHQLRNELTIYHLRRDLHGLSCLA